MQFFKDEDTGTNICYEVYNGDISVFVEHCTTIEGEQVTPHEFGFTKKSSLARYLEQIVIDHLDEKQREWEEEEVIDTRYYRDNGFI